ncbi:MAG: DUF2500 domain-containing protein [Ruminococcaceae bacterium]|nr:DUF2500 domain-containing protein [Oscillospiraceae bacterium]
MFDIMFVIVPVFVTVIFVIVIGTFIVTAVRGVSEWSKNNASPRLTVDASVVTKRQHNTSHRTQHGHRHHHSYYYVTFQVDSGDRMELSVTGQEFGLIAEGDTGKLTFQGTRFLGFERNR